MDPGLTHIPTVRVTSDNSSFASTPEEDEDDDGVDDEDLHWDRHRGGGGEQLQSYQNRTVTTALSGHAPRQKGGDSIKESPHSGDSCHLVAR